jgi:RNA polymerase sigma-70 factor (ECF subfamily)
VISDEELMTSVAKGDVSAFESIVLRYQDSVWRVANRFIGNSTEAQDITQTVFLKLFEAAPRYYTSALVKTYLFRIVNTTCIDYSRKKKPFVTDEPPDVPDNSLSAIDTMVNNEKIAQLKHAIENLPLRQRTAIILRYEAELSIRDIADILKVTEKAIERLLSHARIALFTSLKDSRLQ